MKRALTISCVIAVLGFWASAANSNPSTSNRLHVAKQRLSDLRVRYTDLHPAVQDQLRIIESLERKASVPAETTELQKAKARMEELRLRYTDKHPIVQVQLRRIAELERGAAASSQPSKLAEAKGKLERLRVRYTEAHLSPDTASDYC